MNKTEAFFVWFFTGLNGLGGWFLFLLLAVAAVGWLLYDTSRRKISALGWKTGVFVLAALMLPALIYRFSSMETQLSLDPFIEAIFYLGLLGGILPLVLDIGYYVTFQGMVGCTNGHIYESRLGDCPECARNRPAPAPRPEPSPRPYPTPKKPTQENIRPPKPKAQAWLTTSTGRSYQLNLGETTIGRHSANDIQIDSLSISRDHAKISEQNGHFRLVDLDSNNGTWLNGKRLRQPTLLEANDEIRLGNDFSITFISR